MSKAIFNKAKKSFHQNLKNEESTTSEDPKKTKKSVKVVKNESGNPDPKDDDPFRILKF